jgi:hypothetical protein
VDFTDDQLEVVIVARVGIQGSGLVVEMVARHVPLLVSGMRC